MYSTARDHVFRRLTQIVLPFCLQFLFVLKAESVLYSELVLVWLESLKKDHYVKPPGMPHTLWAAFEGGITGAGSAGASGDVALCEQCGYWCDHHDYRDLHDLHKGGFGHRF